jgi:superfamily II DNA/RNA helicase
MGFYNDIMTIGKQLPKKRETMLFSATMPEEIRRLAADILTDPLQITLALAKPADGITQQAYICHEGQKPGIIKDIFRNESCERVILFASRKTKVKEISLMLKKQGFNVGEMHSDLSQSERDEIMYQYKSRKIDIIVATDILARGIDIDDIRIVINYDVPRDCDDYIHRIGRTARAGTKGRAITFVSEEDQEYFKRIEDFIEQDVPKLEVPAELGEAPAYEPKKKKEKKRGARKDSRGGKGRKESRNGRRGRKPAGKKENAAEARQEKRKPEAEKSNGTAAPQVKENNTGEEKKRQQRRRYRRRPRKNNTGEQNKE